MKRILMVWDGDYPWDVRVEKVALTLIEAGCEVHLVCRNSNASTRREISGGINLRRIRFPTKLMPVLSRALTFPVFFSPLWLGEINKAISEIKPNLMLVRDLPMAPAAIALAKFRKVPVVLDMAECYPEMLRCAWKYEPFRFSNILVRNPYLADLLERICVRAVDRIWVMVEESGKRLEAMGVPSKKISVVSNTPRRWSALGPTNPPADSDNDRAQLTVVYVGLLNPSRGLDTLLEAAALVSIERPGRIKIRIAGSGKHEDHLREKMRSLNLGDVVEMLGWVDHSQIRNLLACADVGIVPHYYCSHWNNTIPNKIFDYMAESIPVLTSNAVPAKRIVEETGAGLVYSSTSSRDLADKLIMLLNPTLRRMLGESGCQAVKARYNWSNDAVVLFGDVVSLHSKC
jgi:glycosyltransferase involved in cell wall biosynthesis